MGPSGYKWANRDLPSVAARPLSRALDLGYADQLHLFDVEASLQLAQHRRLRGPSCAPKAGRDPYDKDLIDLVGELSTRSEAFRQRWAANDVRYLRTGRKPLHHPVVGDLELDYEASRAEVKASVLSLGFTS